MTNTHNNVGLQGSPRRACAIDCFATAWTLGTGLPTSLKPGHYSVTDSIRIDGIRYVTLDERYRIAADSCKTA